jgi:hypothetical protein
MSSVAYVVAISKNNFIFLKNLRKINYDNFKEKPLFNIQLAKFIYLLYSLTPLMVAN